MARLASMALLRDDPKREFFSALILASHRPEAEPLVSPQALAEASDLLDELRGQEWAQDLMSGAGPSPGTLKTAAAALVEACSRLLAATYYHAAFESRVVAELVLIEGALAERLSGPDRM